MLSLDVTQKEYGYGEKEKDEQHKEDVCI